MMRPDMPLTFPEDLLVGIEQIDDEHRAFYEEINELHAAMRAHELGRVSEIVVFLEGYVRHHFSNEERLMVDQGYPGFPEHLARHEEFITEFKRWRARFADKGVSPALVVELSDWLTRWLGDHVRKVDGELARFLRGRTARPGH
jgi:hemerythrin